MLIYCHFARVWFSLWFSVLELTQEHLSPYNNFCLSIEIYIYIYDTYFHVCQYFVCFTYSWYELFREYFHRTERLINCLARRPCRRMEMTWNGFKWNEPNLLWTGKKRKTKTHVAFINKMNMNDKKCTGSVACNIVAILATKQP